MQPLPGLNYSYHFLPRKIPELGVGASSKSIEYGKMWPVFVFEVFATFLVQRPWKYFIWANVKAKMLCKFLTWSASIFESSLVNVEFSDFFALCFQYVFKNLSQRQGVVINKCLCSHLLMQWSEILTMLGFFSVVALRFKRSKQNLPQMILEGSLVVFKFNFELAFLSVNGVKKMKLQTTSKTVSGWMSARI